MSARQGFFGRTRGKGDVVTMVKSVSLGSSAGFNEWGENGFRDVTQDLHNSGSHREPSVSPGKCRARDFMSMKKNLCFILDFYLCFQCPLKTYI